MPTARDYRPSYTLRDLSPDSSVADIILRGGERQAQLLMEAGRQKAAAFEGIGSELAGAATTAFNAHNDAKVQGAVRSAAAPGADINAILGGLPPELQGRAMKGISDWNEYTTKRQESDVRVKKLQDDLKNAERERQQHDLDKLAVGAHHVESLFDTAQGAVAGINMLYSGAKTDKLTDDRFDDFVASVNDGWQAAQGDPAREAQFLAALKQQAGPVLQGLKQHGSASVQEKFKPQTRVLTTRDEAGNETSEIVNDVPGVTRTSAAKVEPGSFEAYVRTKYGPRPTAEQQVKAREDWAEAGRAKSEDAAVSLSGPALDITAENFAKTGQLPPMGTGPKAAAARANIINRAAELHPELDLAGAAASYRADRASLQTLQKQTDAVSAFESTASKNADLLEETLKKLPDTGTSILNAPLRGLEGKLGSEDIARFNTIRQSVQNEYARIISNPTLAGTMSDSARKEGEAILSGNLTVGQLRAALKVLKAEAKNRHTSYSEQLSEIKKRMGGGSGTPAAGTETKPAGGEKKNPFRK